MARRSSSPAIGAEGNYTWDTVRMGGGGFVTGIITSKSEPGLVYARTDVGGAYRWDSEAGEAGEWIPLNNWVSAEELRFLGIESLAIDESSPNKVYMLAGTFYWTGDRTAILRSDDYGATFEVVDVSEQFRVHGNGNGRQTGERLQVDPNNGDILYSGSRWTGLFKSVDAGKTWARLSGLDVTTTPNDNGVHLVVIDPTSASNGTSQTLFVGVSRYGDNFYRSDDAGATFTPVAGAPTDLIPQHAVLHSDGNLYLAYANGVGTGGHANASLNEPMDRGQIWKYSPDAGTWTNLTPANVTSAFGGISVDPSNPQRMIVSTMNTWMAQGSAWGDRILLSNDGGANWTDLIARGFDVDPDGTQLRRRREFSVVGSLPNDGSKRLTVVPGKEGHLWAAVNWQGLRRSTDGGSTFQSIADVTYCEAVGVGAAAPDADYLTVYIWGTVNGQRGLYRSTDEGASWTRSTMTPMSSAVPPTVTSWWVTCMSTAASS